MNNLWAIAFRPFFLVGSLVSMFLVLFWSWIYFSGHSVGGYFSPVVWHAHEMIYGFALAIVAGFILTASANWTKSSPLSGKKLIWLFGLWFLGRIAMLLSLLELPHLDIAIAVIDILFIPFLILALAPPLIRARRFTNIQFIPVLALLGIGNVIIHLASLDYIDPSYSTKGIYLGVNLILLIIVIMGGRIVPAFTSNALRIEITKWPVIEYLSITSVWAYIFSSFFISDEAVIGWVALAAGILNLIRLSGWKSLKTLHQPLLWILHLGYAWIVVGFFLLFLSNVMGVLTTNVAIHAFTAGSMGTFIIGMMTRVSLGHTGRPLKLMKGVTLSYIFITLSGVVRVLSGFFLEYYDLGILVAGILWGLSFLTFLILYSNILISPRADGRPG